MSGTAAAVFAALLAATDPSPNVGDLVIPNCSQGLIGVTHLGQAYYRCVEEAARRFEPSREPAEAIARGAMASCDSYKEATEVSAGTCDYSGATTNLKADMTRMMEGASDDAIRVVLIIRSGVTH